jgi:hypothetical protein
MERKQKKNIPDQQAKKVPSAKPPTDDLPTDEMLTDDTPTDKMPLLKIPAEEIPSQKFPSLNSSIEDIPTVSFSLADLPAQDLPKKKVSLAGLPVEEPHVEDLPTKKVSLAGLPVEEPHVEDLPTKKVSLAGLPVADTPVEDLPTKKVSLAGLPATDLPTEVPSSPAISQQPVQAKKPLDHKPNFAQLAVKSLILAVFIGLATYSIFYTWSSTLATSKVQPETFTELYFENSTQLPSQVVPKHPYAFQFTLHNLESKNMEYRYEVYLEAGNNKLVFDKGTVFVKENNYKTIQERFVSASVLPKSAIVVDLTNKNQQIDFLIEGKA